ncbi:hypothetical protein [Mycobacterium sp. NAZ190054]|uniref:hypothetical protein n=1 Tax=Mycobacterium sp. NAZ190054 TaxID=1747766 RepID=UPI0012E37891|nr:hypothetical protein [Mycobacterium sp. NAZ190054]
MALAASLGTERSSMRNGNHPFFSTPTSILDVLLWDIRIRLTGCDRDGYVLWWTDGGPNEWTEEYETLSVALMRVACLQRCVENDWDLGLVHAPGEFPAVAEPFLDKATH